jgi:hypothetical protein
MDTFFKTECDLAQLFHPIINEKGYSIPVGYTVSKEICHSESAGYSMSKPNARIK